MTAPLVVVSILAGPLVRTLQSSGRCRADRHQGPCANVATRSARSWASMFVIFGGQAFYALVMSCFKIPLAENRSAPALQPVERKERENVPARRRPYVRARRRNGKNLMPSRRRSVVTRSSRSDRCLPLVHFVRDFSFRHHPDAGRHIRTVEIDTPPPHQRRRRPTPQIRVLGRLPAKLIFGLSSTSARPTSVSPAPQGTPFHSPGRTLAYIVHGNSFVTEQGCPGPPRR
jgi:hypothetical protein